MVANTVRCADVGIIGVSGRSAGASLHSLRSRSPFLSAALRDRAQGVVSSLRPSYHGDVYRVAGAKQEKHLAYMVYKL